MVLNMQAQSLETLLRNTIVCICAQYVKSFISYIKWTGRDNVTNCQADPQKNKDPYKALMNYRNTKNQGLGKSPAQMFIGRRLKTNVHVTAYLLHLVGNNQHPKLQARQMQYKEFHDHKETKNIPDLHPEDNVMLQDGNTWRHATVESKLPLPKPSWYRVMENSVGGIEVC